MTAGERAELSGSELVAIQNGELNAVTTAYLVLGGIMLVLFILILFTRMPKAQDDDKTLDLKGTWGRLKKNKNYVWGVIAQFFYVGAQIAVWSFIIRYVMQQLNFDMVISQLGANPSQESVIAALRGVEPLAGGFYALSESLGIDALLPRTAEQAGATYYILSLVLFVLGRFICTWLMKYTRPVNVLSGLGILSDMLPAHHLRARVRWSVCPDGNFRMHVRHVPHHLRVRYEDLGEDTKIAGSGMVMAIAGAAVLTQLQGIVSDQAGGIAFAYWVPAIAFIIITIYSFTIARSGDKEVAEN